MSKFEWPCDKRTAHGPHPVTVINVNVSNGSVASSRETCPGVGAHPATQIGGDCDEW